MPGDKPGCVVGDTKLKRRSMRTLIVSDSSSVASRVREALQREGHECSSPDPVPLDLAAPHVADVNPEFVVVVLSPEPERALAVLQEVRHTTPGCFAAVGPGTDPRLILRALKAGADHYLDEDQVEDEVRDLVGRLKGLPAARGEPGRVVCLLAAGGGTGSSTLAANLATVLAQEHKTCALIDLQLDTDDLTPLLDLKPTHTLADLCANAARMDRVMFERALTRHPSGVSLLASPQKPEDAERVSPEGVREALTWARKLFPFVVVDLGHHLGAAQVEAVRLADLVLLDFRLDLSGLRIARRLLARLQEMGVDPGHLVLVADRYGQSKELSLHDAEQCLERKIIHSIPDDPRTINQANNKGVPAVLESPRARVCRSIAQLARSLAATRFAATAGN